MSHNNFQSNYWKIDHEEKSSTSYIPTNTSLSIDLDTVAIGSNYLTENLKIFQLTTNSLIHLASITLPDIQNLKFLESVSLPPYDFKFLMTGHSNGIAHLSTIPLVDNSSYQNAEIIKRFNHKKHIKLNSNSNSNSIIKNRLCLNNGKISTAITSIQLTNHHWKSTPLNSMISIYDHHLFLWDTSRSKSPLSLIPINGISNSSINKNVDSLVAVVGDFGVSLLDLRTGKESNNNKTSVYIPKPILNSSTISNKYNGCTYVEWCETNENYLATAQPSNNSVYLWDIRKMEPITELSGFSDSVTQIQWSGNTLWTGDDDGYLTKWNLKNLDNLKNHKCIISNKKRLTDTWDSSLTGKSSKPIECGQSMKISNSKIISMDYNSQNDNITCIDGSFLSTHETTKLKVPKTVERISCNTTAPINQISSNNVISTKSSSSSFDSASRSELFDSVKDFRRGSYDTTIPSSPTSTTDKRNKSGDYIESFQKEIDLMIKSLETKVIDDTVYI